MHRFVFLNQNQIEHKILGHVFGIWEVKRNVYINFHKTYKSFFPHFNHCSYPMTSFIPLLSYTFLEYLQFSEIIFIIYVPGYSILDFIDIPS